MFELLQQIYVSYIWFNNKMILLLLVGLGDYCVWIIWFYQIGNRQVQFWIYRIIVSI